jgi:uncharacterized membrane protein required for colicin V production
VVLGLIVVFAIRGLFRGSVGQLFGLAGFVAGFGLAILVSRWVGARWMSARPAALYWALRWFIAGVVALLVSFAFHTWGESLRRTVHAGPAAALDRALGVVIGGAIGLAWSVALLTFMLLSPHRLGFQTAAVHARTPRVIVHVGVAVCDAFERRTAALQGLGRVLHEAERRIRGHSPVS